LLQNGYQTQIMLQVDKLWEILRLYRYNSTHVFIVSLAKHNPTYNKWPMSVLSVECTAFRLAEIMGKRAVVSGEFVPSNVWLNIQ